MNFANFTPRDLEQIRSHGLTMEQALAQMNLFSGPPPLTEIERPATAGDGIERLGRQTREELIGLFDKEAGLMDAAKFVPASGAATRMFKALLTVWSEERHLTRDAVAAQAQIGTKEIKDALAFMDGIRDFAFFEHLEGILKRAGLDAGQLIRDGHFSDIFDALLSSGGLNYAELPKGLIAFHRYPEGPRTSFEEHLVEISHYLKGDEGVCRLSMTVSPEHLSRFEALLRRVKAPLERRLGVSFEVKFSVQKNTTDTIAVGPENSPFRTEDGKILFRPGGHGALIDNLNELDSDLAFITNIDNVVPDRLKPEVVRWKKIIGGYLFRIRERAFHYLERLSKADPSETIIAESESFAADVLHLPISKSPANISGRLRKEKIMTLLNRPIRVCGMVKNQGEPGGGPFWVKDKTGTVTLQIVEKAQVDMSAPDQKELFEASTHFNPVDIVCSLKDHKGVKFDLKRFVDPEAVFIARKSYQGRDLKALELPGLWNGAMAGWITIFLEVPASTFNPVKTVNDLLRPAHRNDLPE